MLQSKGAKCHVIFVCTLLHLLAYLYLISLVKFCYYHHFKEYKMKTFIDCVFWPHTHPVSDSNRLSTHTIPVHGQNLSVLRKYFSLLFPQPSTSSQAFRWCIKEHSCCLRTFLGVCNIVTIFFSSIELMLDLLF